ncbi:MAG: D-alanine--D-alanine ligase [Phycisphaerales bacterium JB061]
MSFKVSVLGGGPDAERDVSIESSTAVTKALNEAGVQAELVLIDKPESLTDIRAEVLFPVLHGRWGEGGPLQDLLECDGRPYVGCRPAAARLAMDKVATKLVASRLGIRTPEAVLFNANDRIGMQLPYVIKPALEGSSVGLFICRTEAEAEAATKASKADIFANPGQVTMVERLTVGREITCPVIERGGALEALPLVEIAPAEGVYDYEAKYQRDDTVYTVAPGGIDTEAIQRDTQRLAEAIGVRHLARADFIIDSAGDHWLLEINTMPGFTAHSLFPQAAAHVGMPMPALCAYLAESALAGHQAGSGCADSSPSPR